MGCMTTKDLSAFARKIVLSARSVLQIIHGIPENSLAERVATAFAPESIFQNRLAIYFTGEHSTQMLC